jgi:hypothetical protein
MYRSRTLTMKDLPSLKALLKLNGWDVKEIRGGGLECKPASLKFGPGSTRLSRKGNPMTQAQKIDSEPNLRDGGLF